MSFLGNNNLCKYNRYQYLTVDGTSDTVTLSSKAIGVRLTASSDEALYVAIGKNPTAVAATAEKTVDMEAQQIGMLLQASEVRELAIPRSTDASPCKVAAIQSSAGGTLHVEEIWFE